MFFVTVIGYAKYMISSRRTRVTDCVDDPCYAEMTCNSSLVIVFMEACNAMSSDCLSRAYQWAQSSDYVKMRCAL